MKKIIAVWLAVLLTATVVEAFNISPFTFKLRSRATPGDSTFIRGDTMFTNEMNVLLGVTIQATNKLRADTLQSLSTHDTTRVLGTMFADTARVGGRLYFGWAGFSHYLDSARVDSIIQQLGRFAPGGAGSGDIEGVTAGDGLSGGGITGTVTLDVKPGWGIKIDNDSVEVNATQVMDSISGSAASDSDAIRYRTDRIQSYTDTGLYFGDPADETFLWYNLTDTNIIAFVKVYYNEDLPDSALVTWHTLQDAIAGMGGDITGVVTNSPITGGAASGDVNLALDMDWFVAWLDSVTTATIPVADTARQVANVGSDLHIKAGIPGTGNAEDVDIVANDGGGRIRLEVLSGTPPESAEVTIHNNEIRTFAPIIFYSTITLSSSAWKLLYTNGSSEVTALSLGAAGTFVKGNGTSSAPTFGAIASDADLWNKFDTTSATPPHATLADSSVKYDTATTLQWAEGRTIAHDTLWGNSPGFATKANVHDSLYAPGFLLKSLFKDSVVATGAKIPKAALADSSVKSDTSITLQWAEGRLIAHDTLWANSPGFLLKSLFKDSVVATGAKIPKAALADSSVKYDTATSLQWAEGRTIAHDTLWGNSVGFATKANVRDSIWNSAKVAEKLPSVNFKDSLGTGRVTSTIILNQTIAPADIDSSGSVIIGTLRTRAAAQGLIQTNNLKATDPDSSLKIGSGAPGLTISSALTIGSDITDDTLTVDYYPEYVGMVLGDGIMSTYKDSMKLYGNIESNGGFGNVLVFSDSLLNNGLHRRCIQLVINPPLRTDTLRYVIIQGLVKDSSGTNEMYLKAMLRTTTFTSTNVDSNAAGNIKDYDSLGGDYTDNAVVRTMVLSCGAVTPGTPLYLLIIGRHDSGTAYNWAEVGRVRCVYSRTAL